MKTVLGVATLLFLYALTTDASGAHDGTYWEVTSISVDKLAPAPECKSTPSPDTVEYVWMCIRQGEPIPELAEKHINRLINDYKKCVVKLYDLAVRSGTAPSRHLRSAVEEECTIRHVEGAKYAKERTTAR